LSSSQTDLLVLSRQDGNIPKKSMAVLQGLPSPFLHSVSSGHSEGRCRLFGAPLRLQAFMEHHRYPLVGHLDDIDGVLVGEHPIIKRLMGGVFNKRPPRREAPTLWDPLKVLSVFQHWPVDLPLSSLMRKGAFLMAIATAKRVHELASLLSDTNHFRWEGDAICFTLTRLTKTDRPGHLCPLSTSSPGKRT
jgi:hypothetical protein